MYSLSNQLFPRYPSDKDFKWNIDYIISRVLGIRIKQVGQHVLNMRFKNEDECINILKKINGCSRELDFEIYCEIMKGVMSRFKIAIPNNMMYLDVGCNNGLLTKALGKVLCATEMHGIDVKKCMNQHIANIKVYDGTNIPYGDNTFDFVTIFQTLHHIHNINDLIHDIHRVIKKDGILMIKEHNCDNDDTKKFVEFEHVMYDIKKNINIGSDDLFLRSEEEWNVLLAKYGFIKKEIFAYPKEPTNTYYSIYGINK